MVDGQQAEQDKNSSDQHLILAKNLEDVEAQLAALWSQVGSPGTSPRFQELAMKKVELQRALRKLSGGEGSADVHNNFNRQTSRTWARS